MHDNIRVVYETQIDDNLPIIVEATFSFIHNKMKLSMTSSDDDFPAEDEIHDFNTGEGFTYYNKTGECGYIPDVPKMNLADYWLDMLSQDTTFVGKRGEHLELWEIKPSTISSRPIRVWLYGTTIQTPDTEDFQPLKLQYRDDSQDYDFVAEFLDTLSTPEVAASEFEYDQCKKIQQKKSNGNKIKALMKEFAAKLV